MSCICKSCGRKPDIGFKVGEDRYCARCAVEAFILTKEEVALILARRKPQPLPPEDTQPCW